jgi:hypothetical protein
MNSNRVQAFGNDQRATSECLLDGIGWGACLITIGILWLLPERLFPHGSLLIALGFIVLVLNAARYFLRIRVNGFTLVAGIMAILAGAGAALGLNLPLFPIALIVIGICMLLVPDREDGEDSSAPDGCSCCR